MKKNARRAGGFYVQTAAVILGALALILYLNYSAKLGNTDILVVLGIVLGAAACGFQLTGKFTFPVLLGAVIYSVTAFYFVTGADVVGSFADYFSNIVAFGHPELVGNIVAAAAPLLISAIMAIIGSFLPTYQND